MFKSVAALLCVAVVLISVTYAKRDKRRVKLVEKNTRLAQARYSKRAVNPNVLDCPSTDFACPDRCIDLRWECDGSEDCANGFDEAHCSAGCTGKNKFECNDKQCVSAEFKCDGDNDCTDGSDEISCADITCYPEQHKCPDGHCIPGEWVCDGNNDCGDSSEEQNCVCDVLTKFKCPNGKCIPKEFECDGDNDCGDRGDELHCSCTTDQIACASGGCVPNKYHCDGNDDCGDQTDEKNCPDIHPGACADKLPVADCHHLNVTSNPICLQHAEAFKNCRKFCGVCLK